MCEGRSFDNNWSAFLLSSIGRERVPIRMSVFFGRGKAVSFWPHYTGFSVFGGQSKGVKPLYSI